MEKNLALLIDAENISPDYISTIIDEANKYGKISYRRIYGDWSTDRLKAWKSKCIEFGLTQVQQYSYVSGKNTSDFTLIIDAMDILYRDNVGGFCIVSSDSDFTKLVLRLKENNMHIIGMGESKTPLALVNSCDNFVYLDKIAKAVVVPAPIAKVSRSKKKKVEEKSSIAPLETVLQDVERIIADNNDEDGWAHWSLTNHLLLKKYPGFDPRNYNFKGKALTFLVQQGFDTKKDALQVFIRPRKKTEVNA